ALPRAAAGRPAPVHADQPDRPLDRFGAGGDAVVGPAGRPHTRGAAARIVRRQLQPGGRLEGHLDSDGGGMISRVADHCFWVGRYLDRAESTARLLQVTRQLAFDAELPALECWRPVVVVSGQYPDFITRFGTEAAGNG